MIKGMLLASEFEEEVLLKCYGAMEKAGFTRFSKRAVDWPLEDGFHLWVGLNTNQEHGCLQINPFVGLHAIQIERLWTRLKSLGGVSSKYSRTYATYAVHMGELAPSENIFRFTQESSPDAEIDRLVRLYIRVGLSYAQAISGYDHLLPLVQSRVEMLGAYPERVASCLYLMGRREEAKEFTQRFLGENEDYFQPFAVPFLELLNEKTSRS